MVKITARPVDIGAARGMARDVMRQGFAIGQPPVMYLMRDRAARTLAAPYASPGTIGRHLAALATGADVDAADVLADVDATRCAMRSTRDTLATARASSSPSTTALDRNRPAARCIRGTQGHESLARCEAQRREMIMDKTLRTLASMVRESDRHTPNGKRVPEHKPAPRRQGTRAAVVAYARREG